MKIEFLDFLELSRKEIQSHAKESLNPSLTSWNCQRKQQHCFLTFVFSRNDSIFTLEKKKGFLSLLFFSVILMITWGGGGEDSTESIFHSVTKDNDYKILTITALPTTYLRGKGRGKNKVNFTNLSRPAILDTVLQLRTTSTMMDSPQLSPSRMCFSHLGTVTGCQYQDAEHDSVSALKQEFTSYPIPPLPSA